MADSEKQVTPTSGATERLTRDASGGFNRSSPALSPSPSSTPTNTREGWLERVQETPGSGVSENDGFYRERLMLFGFLGALCATGKFLLETILLLAQGEAFADVVAMASPRWVTIAVALMFLALGIAARSIAVGRRSLRTLDFVATLTLCGVPPWLSLQTHEGLLAAGGISLMLGGFIIVMWRAASVPSPPIRTLVTSTLALIANQAPAFCLCGHTANDTFPLASRIAWLFLCVCVATAASHVIFGLQRRAKKAERMGQYQLDRKLGAGGMGEVYLAQHALMKRPVAIKLLRQEVSDRDSHLRFEQEVRITSHLENPHTIRIYDYGQSADGRFFYVMERLRGLDLDRILELAGKLPAARTVNILVQACDSLAEAHGRGLVHRDIKPANIILCMHGGYFDFTKVVDFGLVKEVGSRRDQNLTAEGSLMGTPLFLAPELVRDPGAADARSDLYALGCVAFMLLTGRSPFKADTVVEVLEKHLNATPPPISDFVENVPEDLNDIVQRLLAKEPAERFSTAAELAAALKQVRGLGSWTQYESAAWWRRHESELENVSTPSDDTDFFLNMSQENDA